MLDSGGLSGTASPSDSCTVILVGIAAFLESQLEIVSAVPSRVRGRRAGSGEVGKSGCSAKVNNSAPHEARTLLEAVAGTSRTHSPTTPTRAITSKSDVPPRQPLDLAEELAKLTDVLDEPRNSQSVEKRVQSGYGSGNKRNEVHRGLRRRIRRKRATTPRCSTFCTPITKTPALSLRHTGRRYEKI